MADLPESLRIVHTVYRLTGPDHGLSVTPPTRNTMEHPPAPGPPSGAHGSSGGPGPERHSVTLRLEALPGSALSVQFWPAGESRATPPGRQPYPSGSRRPTPPSAGQGLASAKLTTTAVVLPLTSDSGTTLALRRAPGARSLPGTARSPSMMVPSPRRVST